MKRALALVLLGGCRWVFGIDTTRLDDGATDGVVADSDAVLDGPPCPSNTRSAVADAVIVATNPAQNFGTATALNISKSLTSRALFRFDVSTVPPVAQWSVVVLTLPYEMSDDSCSATCGSCAALETSGKLHVHPMRSDWSETSVNYTNRVGGQGWDAAGASGSGDASVTAIDVGHQATQDTIVPIVDPDALAMTISWVSGNQLSFLVRADSDTDGAAIVRSREATCGGNALPASITIYHCP